MTDIRIRRAYVEPGRSDGQRVLIDRLWPRGISKDALTLDDWVKELAPSHELRKWFDHDPEKWDEFQRRYAQELDTSTDAVSAMRVRLKQGRVTFVYGAKDEIHNNAVALKCWFENRSHK